jgi:hypothetical protein
MSPATIPIQASLRRGTVRGDLPWSGFHFHDEGATFDVVRGRDLHRLGAPGRDRHMRWYVVAPDATIVGNGDGYRSLREVREHVAAVRLDRHNGYASSWWREPVRDVRATEPLSSADEIAAQLAGQDLAPVGIRPALEDVAIAQAALIAADKGAPDVAMIEVSLAERALLRALDKLRRGSLREH